MAAALDVVANLNFTMRREDDTYESYIGYDRNSVPAKAKTSRPRSIARECLVRDARSFADYPLSLGTVGFELVRCEASRCLDFQCRKELVNVYIPEVEALVRTAIGRFLAESSVFCGRKIQAIRTWDICLRRGGLARKPAEISDGIFELAPLSLVHADFYGMCAPKLLHQLLHQCTDTLNPCGLPLKREHDPLDMTLYVSGALPMLSVNVWRSIDENNPVRQQPLAVCDPATMAEVRRVEHEIHCPDTSGNDARFLPPFDGCLPEDRWFYYPHMTHEECLMFFSEGYFLPSSAEKSGWYNASVPHTSFDLGAQEPVPIRRSVEARVFVFLA
eukprot:TRINITY_DN32856_c0_g1_i1.p1 TRINITY_DN32856_c0_g1~~TRINITY_DN32856_c0_g1_i1.p1  ORF type:complete len:344 (-),score=28.86 TRINITY_DN32856_c0_g1_i1:155-1147(-)